MNFVFLSSFFDSDSYDTVIENYIDDTYFVQPVSSLYKTGNVYIGTNRAEVADGAFSIGANRHDYFAVAKSDS